MSVSGSHSFTLTELLTGERVLQNLPTKDLLLRQGIRLFHEHGVEGTSLGRLLAVTGKSKSQFYSHFKDRDDFICRVLELEMDTMLRVAARHPLTDFASFGEWFSPYVELASLPGNLGCPVGPAANELAPSRPAIRETSRLQFERWEASISASLEVLAQTEKLSSSFEPKAIARLMCCSIQGAFLFGRVYRDPRFVKEVGEHFFRLLKSLKDFEPATMHRPRST